MRHPLGEEPVTMLIDSHISRREHNWGAVAIVKVKSKRRSRIREAADLLSPA